MKCAVTEKANTPNVLASVFLIFLTFVTYWNVLDYELIWDDISIIGIDSGNFFQNVNIWRFFTDRNAYHVPGEIYRPLYLASFFIDYSLYGSDPWGYHLTNLIVHALCTVLVFFTIRMLLNLSREAGSGKSGIEHPRNNSSFLSPSYLAAFLSATLFSIHPIHTESVTWIKGRDDLLGFLFFLSALMSYVHFQKAGKFSKTFYFLSILFFFMGLLSKEMTATLPMILILLNLCFFKEQCKRLKTWVSLIPFFVVLMLYLYIRTVVLDRMAQSPGYWGGSALNTFYTMARVMILYIKLLILPTNLCADYLTYPPSTGFSTTVFFALLTLLGLIAGGIITARFSRITSFGVFWFFVTILPVSNLIRINVILAERFLYIPSFALMILLAVLFTRLNRNGLNKVVLLGFLLVMVFFVSETRSRNEVWKNEEMFWGDVINKYPSSRAYSNYGLIFRWKGELEKAILYYKKAVSLDPVYRPFALNNLGAVYMEKGLVDLAIDSFKMSLRMYKGNPLVHVNLGDAYRRKGLFEKASREYRMALRANPKLPGALKGLQSIRGKIGS